MHLCIWDMKIPFWASSCVSMCKPATLDETEWLLICRIMQQPNLIQLTCSRWRWLFVFYHGDHVMTSISLGILPSHRTNIEKYEGSKPIASCWVQEEAGANRSFVEAGSQSSLLQDAIERNGYAAEPFKSLHGSSFWICRKHASRCLCRFSRCLVRPLRHDVVFPRTQNNTWCKSTGRERLWKYNEMIRTNSIKLQWTQTHTHTQTDDFSENWSGVAAVGQCSCLRLSQLSFSCCEGRDCCLVVHRFSTEETKVQMQWSLTLWSEPSMKVNCSDWVNQAASKT